MILLWCFLLTGLRAEVGGAFVVDEAMRRLGDAEFKVRVAAQSELSEWGKENLEEGIRTFYRAYRTSEDPEIRLRSRDLLKELVLIDQEGEGKGYIGIMMEEDRILLPGGGGELRSVVRVKTVLEGTPAEKARLRVGDLVTGIDDLDLRALGAMTRFGEYVQSKSPKTSVTLHLLRDGKEMDLDVELMKRPPIAERNWLLFGDQVRPPSIEEGAEKQFRDWLKKRLEDEKAPK